MGLEGGIAWFSNGAFGIGLFIIQMVGRLPGEGWESLFSAQYSTSHPQYLGADFKTKSPDLAWRCLAVVVGRVREIASGDKSGAHSAAQNSLSR